MNTSITAVYKSTLRLMGTLTADDTYSAIVQEAQRLADAMYGSIFLMKHDKLVRVYSTVPKELQIVPRMEGYTYQSFKTKKAVVVPVSKMKKIHPVYGKSQTKRIVFIPLSYENYAIGVIALDSKYSKPITAKRMQTLQLFGSLASLKLRNISLLSDLKEAVSTRDLFVSMASHELKTPLTAILAYVELVKKCVEKNTVPNPVWINSLLLSSKRMSRLINELLHINQIRSGKMNYTFKNVLVTDLVTIVLNDFQMSYPTQTLEVSNLILNPNRHLVADRDKLVQVFINLLNNAAKFTNDKKTVLLKIEDGKDSIVFHVIDQGKGIESSDLTHLFEEFYKGKENTKEGLGLGLFISNKIVQAHHGTIAIDSTVGVGTTVTVTLPIHQL